MSDRSLTDLDPALQTLVQSFLTASNVAIAPSKCSITVTWRDPRAQNAAHAAGLSNASAGQSPHNCCDAAGNPASRAFDFAVFDKEGFYITDGTNDRYATCANIGKGLGLVWGGDWDHPDWDHLELQNWKTITST